MHDRNMTCPTKKNCDALFSLFSITTHTAPKQQMSLSSVLGQGPAHTDRSAQKHAGQEGMSDGPPCLWGFQFHSDFKTYFVRKRVKLNEQNDRRTPRKTGDARKD